MVVKKEKLLKLLKNKLAGHGFQKDGHYSINLITMPAVEYSVSVEATKIQVLIQRFPIKKGWSIKSFKNTERGLSMAINHVMKNMDAIRMEGFR
jgi:hypothetical protein